MIKLLLVCQRYVTECWKKKTEIPLGISNEEVSWEKRCRHGSKPLIDVENLYMNKTGVLHRNTHYLSDGTVPLFRYA